MQSPTAPFRTILRLIAALPALAATAAWGYVPTIEEIQTQIAAHRPEVTRAILETRVVVYDVRAGGGSAENEGEAQPRELIARGFHQRIYWIRDTLLAIETYSNGGVLLHFYLDEGLGPLAIDMTEERHFETDDVLHPYLPFMSGTLAGWQRGLAEWGVVPADVVLERAYKARSLYRLEDESGSYALLEPGRLALRRIERRIGAGESPLRLRLDFGRAFAFGGSRDPEKLLYFPGTVDFFLDDRPFKRIVLRRFTADPPRKDFPLKALRERAAALTGRQPPSLREHGIQ